jgi:hypothetical protein
MRQGRQDTAAREVVRGREDPERPWDRRIVHGVLKGGREGAPTDWLRQCKYSAIETARVGCRLPTSVRVGSAAGMRWEARGPEGNGWRRRIYPGGSDKGIYGEGRGSGRLPEAPEVPVPRVRTARMKGRGCASAGSGGGCPAARGPSLSTETRGISVAGPVVRPGRWRVPRAAGRVVWMRRPGPARKETLVCRAPAAAAGLPGAREGGAADRSAGPPCTRGTGLSAGRRPTRRGCAPPRRCRRSPPGGGGPARSWGW